MKKLIVGTVATCVLATSSYACTVEKSLDYSQAIDGLVQELVARDTANLSEVMSISATAAVDEYHEGQAKPVCARLKQAHDALAVMLLAEIDAQNAELRNAS